MTRFAAVVTVLGLAGGLAADDKADALAGSWVVESVVRDGKPDESLKGAVRTNTADKYTVTPAAGSKAMKVSGGLVVDGSKSPVTYDMKPVGGRYDGKTLLGIAKVEGDTLTVCFAEPGKDRPTAFESAPGSGLVLAVHKKK